VVGAVLMIGAAPARADVGSLDMTALLSKCSAVLHPTGASNQPVNSLGYRFCDDGTPNFGGTTPNPTGSNAIRVPAAYRYPDPVPAGVSDRTVDGLPPKDPNGASLVKGTDPVTQTIALDVDITLPTLPAPAGGYPVVVMMHGCCGGNRRGWEATSIDAGGEKWHYNTAWFASRGYVVVTYTARGFVDVNGHGSTGETQIDSLQYEINDAQYLVGLLADDPAVNINPQKVIPTGGSYGGGFSWLMFTDPIWTSPGGKAMKLAAAVPKYGWTDLVYSLVPTGRHFYDFGSPPRTDFSDSGFGPNAVVGIPIRSIIAALFISGQTGIPSTSLPPKDDHATFPSSVQQAFNCTQTVYPAEQNPLCPPLLDTVLPDFLRYRSAYYRNDFFARVAGDPAYRTPVFSAGTQTDPLFPPIEHHRMWARLRATVPGYPIEEYYGDYQHFVQNKAKEWGDLCNGGGTRHVCTSADYPGGDLNAHPSGLVRTGIITRINRFMDYYTRPTGDPNPSAPTFDTTASLQVCPQNATGGQAADEPGPTFSGLSYADLARGRLTLNFAGSQTTTSTVAGNRHAVNSDPVANQVGNGLHCPVETSGAGTGVATYDSGALPAEATMIGGSILTARFTATGTAGVELNARMYDVLPDGTAVMVDRGPRRLTPAEAQSGTVQYQLRGNGWRFPAGHQIRLELTQDDDPTLKRSDIPSSLTISSLQVVMPVREGLFASAHFAPAARIFAPRLASDVSTTPRFTVRWTGSSFLSTLRSFELQVRTIGGAGRRSRSAAAWRTVPGMAATTATSTTFAGRSGETYEFRVRARNSAGLTSAYSAATTVVPTAERPAGSSYRGLWSLRRSRGAFGGRVIVCASASCRATLTYRGGSFYLVARTGPTSGRARVTIDGKSRKVDLYSARTAQRRVVFSARKSIRRHRVKIAVLRTKRAAARGFDVVIDAYGLAQLR
jgi:hypothetical protein